MAKYKVLYWHLIPSQVRAEDENGRSSFRLSARFQDAIDSAAMAARLFSGDDYTDGFEWKPEEEMEGSAEQVVKIVATELENNFSDDDLKALVAKIRIRRREK